MGEYGGPEKMFGNISARFIPGTVDLADQARRLALVQRGRCGDFDSLKALARIYGVNRWQFQDRVLIEDGRPVGAIR